MNHQNMFWEHDNPYFQLLKTEASWHDLVTSKMESSYVSAITWNIYMKLIKNEADSIFSDTKENDGLQKNGVICRYLDRCGRLRRNGPIRWFIGTLLLGLSMHPDKCSRFVRKLPIPSSISVIFDVSKVFSVMTVLSIYWLYIRCPG